MDVTPHAVTRHKMLVSWAQRRVCKELLFVHGQMHTALAGIFAVWCSNFGHGTLVWGALYKAISLLQVRLYHCKLGRCSAQVLLLAVTGCSRGLAAIPSGQRESAG